MATKTRGFPYVEPLAWADAHTSVPGSWWPAWLAEQSGAMGAPPSPSEELCAAPGTNVLQR